MRKSVKTLIISVLCSSIWLISCDNSTVKREETEVAATTLDELKNKYNEAVFTNCDELIKAGDEIVDVYIATIEKAYNGDMKSRNDLDDFEEFKTRIDKYIDTLSVDCMEELDVWQQKTDERISEYRDKLNSIIRHVDTTDLNGQTYDSLRSIVDEEKKIMNDEVLELLGDNDENPAF